MKTQRIASPDEGAPEEIGEALPPRPADLSAVETLTAQAALRRLRMLWQQRPFLLRATLYGALLSLALAFLIPPRFESKMLLMPPEQSSVGLASLMAMTRSSDSLGTLAGDLLGMKTSGALFMGILGSTTVEDRIIERFDLRSVYGVRRMEQARRILGSRTSMVEDRKSGILAVWVTDGDPGRAAAMGRAYVEELDRLVHELNTSTAHRERVFLEERLKTIKLDLDAAARDFGNFASKNAAIDIKEQGKATMEAAAVLEGQLIAAESEREGLRQIYANENVRVRASGAKIAELQKRLEQIGGAVDVAAGSGSLASGSPPSGNSPPGNPPEETAFPSLRQLPLLGVTYTDLYRRTKVEETLYDVLTQQYEFAKVEEAKETPSVKVLDAANIPEKKSYPPRLFITLLGAGLALVFAVAWLWGGAAWREADSGHPAKAFLNEVYAGLRSDLRLVSANRSGLRTRRNGNSVGSGPFG
jgi:capsule polysaccharide export protein KpsE/RkpR